MFNLENVDDRWTKKKKPKQKDGEKKFFFLSFLVQLIPNLEK